MSSIKIGSSEYELAPLRLKHLRKISKQIQETGSSPRTPTFADLDKWLPYIGDSIEVGSKDFDRSILDEMTLQEFTEAWTTLLNVSGFKIVAKGEAKPMEVLTTKESTDALPSAADGPTLQ